MRKTFYGLKKFLAFGLVIITVAATAVPALNVDAAKKKSSNGTYAAGDDIAFGRLDGIVLSWTILSYDEATKTAFVVARKGINTASITAYRKAIENSYRLAGKNAGYVRWSENYWRGWLNQVFYQNSFTDAERAKIQKTTLTAEAAKNSLMNFYHDTTLDAFYVENKSKNSLYMDIYESQTESVDYIFFLSTDEFTTYKESMKFEKAIWPLRTNAYDDPNQGLFVNDTTKLIERKYYYSGDSIRPAMYVKLGETTEDSSTSTDSSKTTDSKTEDKTTTASTTTESKTNTTTTSKTASTTSTAKTTAATTKKTTTKSYANNGTNIGNITLPSDSSYSLKAGGTAQVALDMEYLNSTDKQYNVTYKSSDANIFTVDSSGEITAVGVGTATLTVRMKKSNGKVYTMSCRIDVT